MAAMRKEGAKSATLTVKGKEFKVLVDQSEIECNSYLGTVTKAMKNLAKINAGTHRLVKC